MKKSFTILLTLGIVALLIAECKMVNNDEANGAPNEETRMTNNDNSSDNTPIVEVVHPTKRSFEGALEITGNLEANQSVQLHAMEGGIVKSINKDIGDFVKKGDVIATLSNPELYQSLKMAQSKVTKAKAQQEKANAAIEKAQAKTNLKESVYERLKSIYDKTPDFVTVEDLEMAEAEYLMAQSELLSAKSEPNIINADIGSAKAVVNSIQVRSGMLKIKAPFSGYITQRHVDEGAFIQNAVNSSNAQPIVDLVDVENVRLVIEFPEADMSGINKGSSVKVTFPELRDSTIEATITRMSSALNPQTKTIRAEVDLENKSGKLKPGMYAKIASQQKSLKSSIAIPTQAITAVKNQLFVYKVVDKVVKKIPVKVGLEDKHFIEVVSGDLTEQDWVIVQGKGLVNENMEVIAKEKK